MFMYRKISFVIIFILFKINFHTCKGEHYEAFMKIFNGTRAAGDPAIKHVVSLRNLRLKRPFGEDHICGGSIIKPNLILTAAHCVTESDSTNIFDPQYYYIVAGSPYLYSKNANTQTQKVYNIYVHKGYRRSAAINDIALLELDGKLKEDDKTVQRIDIISSNLDDGELCTIYGWGVIDCYEQENGVTLANIVQSTKFSTIGKQRCMQISASELRPGAFCAVDIRNNSQSCAGDSGSPLICRRQVAGIDSYGDAVTAHAEFFTNVWSFSSWIKNYKNHKESVSFHSGVGRYLLSSMAFALGIICAVIV